MRWGFAENEKSNASWLRVMRVMEAAFESAKTGMAINTNI